ncbi:MAG: (d)CMP kinase [Planctomycetota bacterium]|nr:(d)CMP kinase [Planctomycetota bacterium]
MIVTIDGPAGAGKSSIARKVAQRLGFEFLDTGAMYRAVTLGAIRAQIAFDDVDGLVDFANGMQLRWKNTRILLNGDDVTEEIRSPIVTSAIRHVADLPAIRKQLSEEQRRIAKGRDIVTEGRDQGSEVFPDAECKIFLTASSQERARRRQEQLTKVGRHLPLEDVLRAQEARDEEDRQRPIGSLRPAEDAVVIESDGMTLDEVLEQALAIVAQRQV